MIFDLKKNYRNCFLEQAERILKKINDLKFADCSGDIFEKYEKNSSGYIWQKRVLEYFEKELQLEIENQVAFVKKSRKDYQCIKCGTCCKFAISEFSPIELRQKASEGDKTAKEFIGTFVPYKNLTEGKEIYPEYVEFLEKNSDGNFYIYHCPKVTEDNKCSCYETRPQICRNFPDNPVEFLPIKCGYNGWKNDCEKILLDIRAKIEIYGFYKEKIEGLL